MLKSRKAFTLVELLIVVALLGILMSLLIPTLARVKDAAIRAKCMSNLKQWGLAVHMWAAEHEGRLLDHGTEYPTGAMFTDMYNGYRMADEFLSTFNFDIDSYYCPLDEVVRPHYNQRLGQMSDHIAYDEYWKDNPGSGSMMYGAVSSYVILMGDGTGGRNPRFPVAMYGDETNRLSGYIAGAKDIVYDDEEPDSVIMADSYRYTDRGFFGMQLWWVVSHRSFEPQGLNKLFLDGSVIWRGNRDIKKQYFYSPYFFDIYW